MSHRLSYHIFTVLAIACFAWGGLFTTHNARDWGITGILFFLWAQISDIRDELEKLAKKLDKR